MNRGLVDLSQDLTDVLSDLRAPPQLGDKKHVVDSRLAVSKVTSEKCILFFFFFNYFFLFASLLHKSGTDARTTFTSTYPHIQNGFRFRVEQNMLQALPSPRMAINVKGTGVALNWRSSLTALYEGWCFAVG